MLSSRDRPDAALQRVGHGNFVETQGGESYFVHLCGRPLRNRGRSILGRETAIQKVVWGEDGWPRLAGEAGLALAEVTAPKLSLIPFRPNRPGMISTGRSCRSPSNGSGRPALTTSSR